MTAFDPQGLYRPVHTSFADRGLIGASATQEQQRREGLSRMHQRVASASGSFDLERHADLRDGALLPREPVDRSAVFFWLLMLAGGCAFWIWALPQIIRAFASAIVTGAGVFH